MCINLRVDQIVSQCITTMDNIRVESVYFGIKTLQSLRGFVVNVELTLLISR